MSESTSTGSIPVIDFDFETMDLPNFEFIGVPITATAVIFGQVDNIQQIDVDFTAGTEQGTSFLMVSQPCGCRSLLATVVILSP